MIASNSASSSPNEVNIRQATSGIWDRIFRHTDTPSPSGSRTSKTATSGRNASIPASPEAAVPASPATRMSGSASSRSRTPRRTTSWSSRRNTAIVFCAWPTNVAPLTGLVTVTPDISRVSPSGVMPDLSPWPFQPRYSAWERIWTKVPGQEYGRHLARAGVPSHLHWTRIVTRQPDRYEKWQLPRYRPQPCESRSQTVISDRWMVPMSPCHSPIARPRRAPATYNCSVARALP